ncbi:histidinol-phosphatase HisJ [Desulfotruncus alcoholivorax]|uniref:histidinol-phosphatase HisJ n=1 Tax=Desulfotruncus alcoholivorax TaxID=265477 RepID=UPI00041419A9|nr:histidinol-phosphatase HisJ [Desulfotruncus alcoholivorax]
MNYWPDYHVHTSRCGHAAGEMKEYVEYAIKLGIKEMGFADHIPMYWLDEGQRDPGLAMPEEQLPEYVAQVLRLQETYKETITIKLGLEVDYIPGCEDKARRIIDAYPFDYVLGSVHHIDGWGFDNPAYLEQYRHININDLYHKYFTRFQAAARSGLFDIMAHPDLVKKFNYRPSKNIRQLYIDTARVLKESGVCLEVNAAGLRAPVCEIYPAPEFLAVCCQYGVPVTLGSDAHAPDQVGYRFDWVRDILVQSGYTGLATFEQRKRGPGWPV